MFTRAQTVSTNLHKSLGFMNLLCARSDTDGKDSVGCLSCFSNTVSFLVIRVFEKFEVSGDFAILSAVYCVIL